jgi:cytoskeletal protein RodZ
MLLAFWVAAVVVATAVGLLAVRLLVQQVGDPGEPVLSTKDVGQALSSTPPASRSASPRPTPKATPSTTPATRPPSPEAGSPITPFRTTGGSVGVRCRGTEPQRVYATPAQGWVLDETSTEGGVLEVRFTKDRTRSRIGISCGSGTPVVVERRVDTSGGKG